LNALKTGQKITTDFYEGRLWRPSAAKVEVSAV